MNGAYRTPAIARFSLWLFVAAAAAFMPVAAVAAEASAPSGDTALADKIGAAHRALSAGDHVLAQALFSELIENARLPAKRLSRLYDARGVAYYHLGLNQLAYQDFGRAITLDPGNAMAHNNRGTLYFVTGDRHRALAEYDAALEIDPDFALAWEARGLALDLMGRREEARRSFRKAYDLGRRTEPVMKGMK